MNNKIKRNRIYIIIAGIAGISLAKEIKEKRIFGSIGSELSRQLHFNKAARLCIFGHGENSLYEIEREFKIPQEGSVGEKPTIVLRPSEKIVEKFCSNDEESLSTKDVKILKVKQKNPLKDMLPKLRYEILPICFFNSGPSRLFRNKRELWTILSRYIPSIQERKDEELY